MAAITATWGLSLNCHCPKCEEYVDLVSDADFFASHQIEPCENHTRRSTDVEVRCPECKHEFIVDCEY